MSTQAEVFSQGVQCILEAVMFENWLRFYFITETPSQEDKLFLSVPDQGMQRIRELHPHLQSLAENLNGKELDFETSRSAVCTYVVTEVDGKRIPRNMSDTVFDSSTFQVELHMFNTWVQAHEAQLDKAFLDFTAWRTLFAEWRASDAAREWATQLAAAAVQDTASVKDTVQ